MKSESEYKTALAAYFRSHGHYARRIEDQFSVGFPDMIVKLRGWPPCFIEAKLLRDGHYVYGPTERQYVELMRLHEPPYAYGIVLAFGHDGEMWLSPPSRRIDTKTQEPYMIRALNPIGGLKEFMILTNHEWQTRKEQQQ